MSSPFRQPALGSLEWTTRTDGLLSRRERARFLWQIARFQALALPEQLRLMLGDTDRHRATVDLSQLLPPDSSLTREAEARAGELPPYLEAHSHRTYLWAAALAQLALRMYDREALYVAALLHDTGLSEPTTSNECFTLAGARAVAQAAVEAKAKAAGTHIAAEAIALHINPLVSRDMGTEAELLAAGAALDVVGRHYLRLDRETVSSVLERHPRHAFKQNFRAAWRAHAGAVPRGRAATLQRFGFGLAIRLAPFEE